MQSQASAISIRFIYSFFGSVQRRHAKAAPSSKSLYEAEKQLMSDDKLTWLTAALFQLAPD